MGTVVKIIPDNILSVVDSGEDSWNDYMERTDENPEYYDYSDIQKVVFVLQEDGHWMHAENMRWNVQKMVDVYILQKVLMICLDKRRRVVSVILYYR